MKMRSNAPTRVKVLILLIISVGVLLERVGAMLECWSVGAQKMKSEVQIFFLMKKCEQPPHPLPLSSWRGVKYKIENNE